jgi:general nucleoside transport system permease protein
MNWSSIINTSLIYATFRSATPIIYAALCAAITQQADILNIGTEGIMLTGAFFAVAVSYMTHSWILGVIVAMVAGLVISMIMAVGHIKFKADICAIGMGINLFAIAITKFLLNSVLGKRGTFSEPGIIPIPRVHIKAFDSIGILNDVFNNWAVTEWFVIILVLVVWFLFYKTRWGLHLRAVGQFPMAAQTAGINVSAMKYEAIAISGLIGGLAGAHLSLGYSALFTENMTNSRGFMGVAAMFFGNADPVWTSVGCLVFGLADSVGNRLQAHGLPSQLVLLMPYVVTVVVLAVSMASKVFTGQRRKSSLTAISA